MSDAYECSGWTMVRGFTVTHWQPRPANDAARLRRYLAEVHGTDYGAPDGALAAASEAAQAYVKASGKRWSWLVLAGERIATAGRGPRP